jgi:hypothetical protein
MRNRSKSTSVIIALITSAVIHAAYAEDAGIYKLPSGPKGHGRFGAYYASLKYSPDWDKNWRVADHPDIVVRFDDGGHKFVFWRGTSYIPCWVTDNDIWYTNEFVERRGIHSPNTNGCVEPMSDKQCRYSRVRIIESNDARVVVHWRYAPIDVSYEHPFIDQNTGWFDWVDEYYVIYPDATGVRAITVHSNGLHKWMEFQEGIVVNQPGTLPDENIEAGAVSVANMQGEHKTYYWDKNGGPKFDENPPGANICKINLKNELKPFALVAPPKKGDNLITSYRGRGRRSMFNWWNHWPVSQDALDGRGARSTDRPSHSSLCHIALQIDPPVDCWGSYGYETVITDGILEWTTTQWGGMNFIFNKPIDMTGSVLISFDYADLWSSDITMRFFDPRSRSTEEINLGEFENKLVLNDPQFRHFEKNISLSEHASNADISRIVEVYLEVSGSEDKKTIKFDNWRISTEASGDQALDFYLDFNLPDGSSIEDIVVDTIFINGEEINFSNKADWQPYAQEKNTITKLMLHGMTSKNVQGLVPLAKSWTDAAKLILKGSDFDNQGYDPAQMAYVIEQKSASAQSLAFDIEASKDSPMVNPAIVIKNWGSQPFELTLNSEKMKKGEDYRYGIEKRLSGTDLIIWINGTQDRPASFNISKL